MNNIQLFLNSLNDFTLPTLILMGSMVFLGVSTLLSLRMTRKLNQEYQQVKTIREDLKAFSIAAIGVGKRVLQLEQRQRQVIENQQHSEKVVTYVEPINQTYDEAAAMARQGQTVEAIIQRCGLSHSEAELIFLMNRLDKAS